MSAEISRWWDAVLESGSGILGTDWIFSRALTEVDAAEARGMSATQAQNYRDAVNQARKDSDESSAQAIAEYARGYSGDTPFSSDQTLANRPDDPIAATGEGLGQVGQEAAAGAKEGFKAVTGVSPAVLLIIGVVVFAIVKGR